MDGAVPRLNLNVDDRDERRVARLAALLGLNRTDAIRVAVGIVLAAAEQGQPVQLVPHSELTEPGEHDTAPATD